jgi:F-type H+-transporting ATPase subunit delta
LVFILKSNSEISQRYAKALYELSLESKSLKNIEKDVLNLKSLITKNSNLNELIKSHVISRENKAKVKSLVYWDLMEREKPLHFI